MIPFKAYGHEFTIEGGVVSGDDGDLVGFLNTVVEVHLIGWGIHLGAMDAYAIVKLKEIVKSLDVRAEYLSPETFPGVDY